MDLQAVLCYDIAIEERRMAVKEKKWRLGRAVTLFVFVTLVLSVVYVTIRIIMAPATVSEGLGPHERSKSDYLLMLVQCILGIVAMYLPSMITHRLNLEIPSGMLMLYVIFLYGAIYLGEVQNFYYVIPSWDIILHCFSGAMLGALGFSFVTLLNKSERVPMNLSPIFVAVFAFCFALALGVFWEIYEFSFDGLLGLNMQKFALEDGTLLAGRAALSDTMEDLMVDAAGALAISVIGYISLKYKKGWVEKLLIKIRRTSKQK